MKKRYLLLFVLTPFLVISQERLLTSSSKDSINGNPRIFGSLGANIKLNGYYDVYGGLQESETFNVGQIDVYGDDDSQSFNMDLYQTQIKMEGHLMTKKGQKVKTMIEFDFWGGNGTMRLRKAYVETDHWQIGQNWNNFGDENLWPNIMEWEGPPSGIWVRTPHVKYMNTFYNEDWIYEISLEAPLSDYVAFPEVELLVEEQYQNTPDFTAALKKKYSWGHLRLATILRSVNYIYTGESDNFFGYGFSLTGIYTAETRSNAQFQFVAGKGISAYLTGLAGLGYDGYPNTDNSFDATPAYGGWASYEHYFTPKFHTNLVFGLTHYSLNDVQRYFLNIEEDQEITVFNGDVDHSHYYGIVNLMFDPFERMTIGLELDYGVKSFEATGTSTSDIITESQDRDAMRISFGFMFFI